MLFTKNLRPTTEQAHGIPSQVRRPPSQRSRMDAALTGLALTALLGLVAITPVHAQNGPPPGGFGGGPGGPPPGGFGGEPGQPPDGGGGMNGGQDGAMAQRMGNGPGGRSMNSGMMFVIATVKAADSAAGTITVTTTSGETGTVHVGTRAQITTQQTIKIADLKVGDVVSVQGVPTGLTASRLTAGQAPTGLPVMGGGPGDGPFGGRGDRRPGGDGQTGTGGSGSSTMRASASGTVKALPSQADPHLTVALSQDAVLSVKVADGAEITRYTSLTLDGVKVGDRVTLALQMGGDGTLTASAIGVNLSAGGPSSGGAGRSQQADAGLSQSTAP
jgi:hypothetical protein